MRLPDLHEGSRSPGARAHRRRLIPKIVASLTEAGAEVTLLDRERAHYRLKLSTGLELNFWPTTLKYLPCRAPGPAGDSFTSLLKVVEDPPPPAPPPEAKRAEMNLVNVFADASYDHNIRKGGWGAVIKAEGHAWIYTSGPIPDCGSSMEAELRALANGLQVAINRGLVPNGAAVLLQSDCVPAMSIILALVDGCSATKGPSDVEVNELSVLRRANKRVLNSEGLALIRSLVAGRSIRLYVRHNRGHVGAGGGRSELSNLADKMARKELNRLRKSRKDRR